MKNNNGKLVGKLLAEFAKDIVNNKVHGYNDPKKMKEYIFEKAKDFEGKFMEGSQTYTEKEKSEYNSRNNVIDDVTLKFSKTFKKLTESEKIDHPKHYGGDSQYEVIKVLEAWELDFHLGNVVKYVARAGKKSKDTELEDLKKAEWYLKRRIASLESEK